MNKKPKPVDRMAPGMVFARVVRLPATIENGPASAPTLVTPGLAEREVSGYE